MGFYWNVYVLGLRKHWFREEALLLFAFLWQKRGGRRPPTPLGHSGAEVACRS